MQQRFETSLRDLRLIWRVRRIPAGILDDVANDDARRDAVVVAEADVRAEHLIAGRGVPQLAKIAMFRQTVGKRERVLQPDARRNGFVDERVERWSADDFEHGPPLRGVRADMTRRKGHVISRGRRTAMSRAGLR